MLKRLGPVVLPFTTVICAQFSEELCCAAHPENRDLSFLVVGGVVAGSVAGFQWYQYNKTIFEKLPAKRVGGNFSCCLTSSGNCAINFKNDANEIVKHAFDCDVAQGVKLLANKGPDVGEHVFSLQCRRKIANVTRSECPGCSGRFTLCDNLSKLVGNTNGEFINRLSTKQRVEGECASLKQWLRLHYNGHGEDCSELSKQKVKQKRQLLASGIVFRALLEIAFEPTAEFMTA